MQMGGNIYFDGLCIFRRIVHSICPFIEEVYEKINTFEKVILTIRMVSSQKEKIIYMLRSSPL